MPVIGELELGWRLLPNRFVALTGTNGKTTVAEWLGHVWSEAGEPHVVAGNVGTPLASLAGELDPEATVICECSSFQLEDSVAFAPEVAVLLNVTPDHLDRHGTFEDYLDAKLRIFANQDPARPRSSTPTTPRSASLEIPGDGTRGTLRDRRLRGEAILRRPRSTARTSPTRADRCSRGDELPLAGEHNLRNAMAVAAAALAAGIDREAVAPRPARASPASRTGSSASAEIDGVAYVNDSKATNVAAAAAALDSFDGGVHAILGGSLKGGGFAELVAASSPSAAPPAT